MAVVRGAERRRGRRHSGDLGRPVLTGGGARLEAVRAGGKRAIAFALARLESASENADVQALLDDAWAHQGGVAIGFTGPPGVGKSTLVNALVGSLRKAGRTVAVLAVDPSSRRSGGALLGDRARIDSDPADQGLFIRSLAARDQLGGLAELAMPVMVLFRALFDVVLIETVGVGQSETAVADLADIVVFCAQPGSGDSLQFMKAGVVEIPDIAVVCKADLGEPARRAVADLKGALGLAIRDGRQPDVLSVSARDGEGVVDLTDRLMNWPRPSADLRHRHARAWLRDALTARFGREGLAALGDIASWRPDESPFARERIAVAEMRRRLAV